MKIKDTETNVSESELTVTELVLSWNGREFRINANTVCEGFDRSKVGATIGPLARYYLAVNGDMKSAGEVLRSIVPIPGDELTVENIRMANEVFEALGFKVLDRDRHHDVRE